MPSNRWGDLQPAGILGDRTAFTFHSEPSWDHPFWFSVDIENNYMFVATGRALEIYDLRTNPGTPTLLAIGQAAPELSRKLPGLLPVWQHSDKDWFLMDVDAPVGEDGVVAMSGEDQGVSIWNVTNKTSPTVHYQDEAVYSTAIYTATLGGGTQYAFALGSRSGIGGVYYYSMSAARQLNKCAEFSTGPIDCPGVYRGKLTGSTGGVSIDGVGNFLVVGRVGRAGGFDIWNVADPAAAVKVMTSTEGARGVAIWESGNSIYLATVIETGAAPNAQMRLYDVSCIRSGVCSPTPLGGAISVPGGGTEPTRHITFSRGAGKPFLYLGGEEQAACAVQREYLFDVSNPANPVEITPKGHPEGYWGWYYEGCLNDVPGTNPDGGFNWVAPRIGKFNGEYLYRAAYSILDVHKLAGAQPPVADFSWAPAQIYPGVPVTFTDQSTGNPNSWAWTFEGNPQPTSAAQISYTFTTEGTKQVSLEVTNAAGKSPLKTKTVNVLSPTPAIAGVAANLTSAKICQPITFTANATGRPALSYQWTVLDSQGNPLAAPNSTGTGNPFVWNTQAAPPGNYEVRVVVSTPVANDGTATLDTYQASPSVPAVQLAALPTLPAASSFVATNDPFTSGKVDFHVNVPGATEWRWDFDEDGDGNPKTNAGTWTSDPIAGPNPSHTYSTEGTRQVRVEVRNCMQPEEDRVSAPLVVNITQITPLVARFSVSVFGCSSGACFVDANVPIKFNDESTGAELWDYDWDGNGSFEDAGNSAPRPTHTYSAQGSFTPKLRVRRGNEAKEYVLPETLVVGPPVLPQNPSISVSGPTSGQPNQALSFTATPSNCTPAANWSWSSSGGTVSGTGSTVTITWTSNGSKTVSVTNSGCSGATGTRSVTISSGPTNPPPGGGSLRAAYAYSPVTPQVGQPVSFDGTSSTGGPTGYVWDFGDGTAFGSGAQVQHTFTKAGTFKVQLSVTGPGSCPPAPFCENATTKTIVVGTGEAPLVAAFQTNANCISEFGLEICNAETGKAVQFTDASTGSNITTRSWSFGDGQTGSGSAVSHTFTSPGTYTVTLTIGNGSTTSTATRTLKVDGAVTPPPSQKKTVVLPWIAQTRGALVQSSDLYIYNPATTPIEVAIQFLKRGTPEANPPKVTRTIQPGATLFVADVLSGLFSRENIAGFVTVSVEQGAEPIITSFNTTFQDDGTQFGQTIPGVSMSQSAAKATQPLQHLVGLNDNSDRLAYFGVSNPGDSQATYRLRFFDHLGTQIGQSEDMPLSPYGQQQFQVKQIREQFGISDEDDYRVEVETKAGGQLFPYAANLRLASEDPSFVESVTPSDAKAYLVGVFSTPGIGGSRWQSDVVLSNTTNQVVITEVRFLSVGVQSAPTQPVTITLQPGETQRIDNVLAAKWGLSQTVGVLLFDSNSTNGVFPVILGEVYDNARPEKRFGQTMTAQVAADVAGNGKSQVLVGLRQDASYRSTITLYNPSSDNATFDVVYRALDGTVLGTLANQSLAPGKARQINPGQHALPAQGVTDGFTVELKVKGGSLLSTGQVVNNRTNDPAFIRGRVR